MSRRTPIAAFALVLIQLVAVPASAALNRCTVSSTPVSFGNYDVFSGTDVLSTGSVTISNCTGTGSATVSLDKGQHSTTFTTRNLQKLGGTDLLQYNLYLDAARTSVWGDGTGGSSQWSASGNGSRTVFGKIPAGQTAVSIGTYGDTVAVTINF